MKEAKRTTHTIDAAGQAPGRVASQAAALLIGKHKPDFMPNMDMGDAVEVVNAAKIKATGKKMDQKAYRYHTAHPGGFKETLMKTAFEQDPAGIVRRAVSRMLPKNRLRDQRLNRLTIKN